MANDLSALYWNPAGLSQVEGFNLHLDYTYLRGTEDFSVDSGFSSQSNQDYSFSRNEPRGFAVSYQGEYRGSSFAVAFGRQRSSVLGSDYQQQESSIGTSIGPFPFGSTSFESVFHHEYSGGEDEYAFAFSMGFHGKTFVGMSWNLLDGEVIGDTRQNSTFQGKTHDDQSFSSTLDSGDKITEKVSGNYFKIGAISRVSSIAAIGAYVKLPYTRKSDIQVESDLSFIQVGGNPLTYISSSQFGYSAEVRMPLEIAIGSSFQIGTRSLLAASFTYSNYRKRFHVPFNFGAELPFPTLRNYAVQSALNQWRVGGEYALGASHNFPLRAGFVINDQPYTNTNYSQEPISTSEAFDDTQFYSFSFGGGYHRPRFRVDAAFIRETGKASFGRPTGGISDHDFILTNGYFSHNRLILSFQLRPF